MGMSTKLKHYLNQHHIAYSSVQHPYAQGSTQSAIVSRIPLAQMAKAVMLTCDDGQPVMAVVPAADTVDLQRLNYLLHSQPQLASEHELAQWFDDCDVGAIPALGEAYSLNTLVDDDILAMADIYMESGDHQQLIHITGDDFRLLASHWQHGQFSTKPSPWSRVERM